MDARLIPGDARRAHPLRHDACCSASNNAGRRGCSRRAIPRDSMRPIHHILTAAVLSLGLVGAPARADAEPTAGHPRLWLTKDHLPRLRAWAADGRNRMYTEAMLPALQS